MLLPASWMAARAQEDAKRRRACRLLLVVFFVFLVIFIVLFIHVIGDEIQVDGMRLRDLKFGFALRTAQDLALFDFVFVDIDFGGTFRATDHGSTLRTVVCIVGVRGPCPPLCSVLYTAAYEVNSRAWWRCFERHRTMRTRTFEWPLPENTPNGRWLASAG